MRATTSIGARVKSDKVGAAAVTLSVCLWLPTRAHGFGWAASPGEPVSCPVNHSLFPPMSCPYGYTCRAAPDPNTFHCHEINCNVCADCCHEMNATMCAQCVKASCNASAFADYQCCAPRGEPCCERGVPLPPSTTLKNCLLIGDSVTMGMYSYVAINLSDVCQTQIMVGLNGYADFTCFNVSGSRTALSEPIEWDVIHFNEGLHSLWPRVNTSAELVQWAADLGNLTDLLASTKATLIYATMTPFMPEKYLNPPGPPQNDVETKNVLAVKTVREHGVTRIDDLYSVVTAHCGAVYKDCDICDDESKYHPEGKCGYHYVEQGWELLSASVTKSVRAALADRERLQNDT